MGDKSKTDVDSADWLDYDGHWWCNYGSIATWKPTMDSFGTRLSDPAKYSVGVGFLHGELPSAAGLDSAQGNSRFWNPC